LPGGKPAFSTEEALAGWFSARSALVLQVAATALDAVSGASSSPATTARAVRRTVRGRPRDLSVVEA
jgi:hypothetical protein